MIIPRVKSNATASGFNFFLLPHKIFKYFATDLFPEGKESLKNVIYGMFDPSEFYYWRPRRVGLTFFLTSSISSSFSTFHAPILLTCFPFFPPVFLGIFLSVFAVLARNELRFGTFPAIILASLFFVALPAVVSHTVIRFLGYFFFCCLRIRSF